MPYASTPALSVCLLTYNHERLLPETVASILAQTFSGFELIISDDCSRDGTWTVIQDLARADSRIRAIRPEKNLGMAGNANFAVSHAIGGYVAILHHDDLCSPQLLEKWMEVMTKHPNVGFVSNAYAYFGSSRIDRHEFGEVTDGRSALERLFFPRWGCPVRGTALVRKSSWDSVGGMRTQFGLLADVDLWMRLARRWDIGYVREPLITVRQERPDDYPTEYSNWSWERARTLYEIHGINREEVFADQPIRRFLEDSWFRVRVSKDELYWLAYGLLKGRFEMLATSEKVANRFETPAIRVARRALARLGRMMAGPASSAP